MGSTCSPGVQSGRYGDHPHIHGEHLLEKTEHNAEVGSPPYTWGALFQVDIAVRLSGITPIYMGSTLPNLAVRFG